jgi:predicted metal-dependent phosphotriesterase family hydrolase
MPMHMRLEFSVITEAIEKIGPEQTILSTDAVETWNPPPHEMMRMFIASLLYLGVGEESIRMMVRDNPRKILQLRETAVDTEENIEQ